MWLNRCFVDHFGRHLLSGDAAELRRQGLVKVLLRAWPHGLEDCVGKLRRRRQRPPERLGQLLDQGNHLVAQQAGHQPGHLSRGKRVQQFERHGHGYTVVFMAGLEMVFQRKRLALCIEGIGKLLFRRHTGVFAQQHVQPHFQGVALGLAEAAEPALKALGRIDLRRYPRIKKLVLGALVGHHVVAPALVLQLLHVLAQLRVLVHEGGAGVHLAPHQGVKDKQFTGLFRILLGKRNPAFFNNHQPVKADLFPRQHPAGTARPVGVEHAVFQQVTTLLLDPLWLNGGVEPGVGPRGLDNFRRHQPLRPTLEQAGAGENMELARTCALVSVAFRNAVPHLAEQASQQRLVDGRIHALLAQLAAAEFQALFPRLDAKLLVQVKPLQHALPVEKFALAHLAELVTRALATLASQVIPQA